MLYIFTDLTKHNWLEYILEEFARINKARFTFKILNINNYDSSQHKYYLFYTRKAVNKYTICNKSGIPPDSKITYINKDLFVLKNSLCPEPDFILNYDLFWNAFVFLSRLEEYITEKKGKNINSYFLYHPRKEKNSFLIPVVNNLFNELETLIKKLYPELEFDTGEPSVIELTHDIDYITKTVQLRIKQTVFNKLNILKNLYDFKYLKKKLPQTIKFFISSPSYWCFDYWLDIEKKINKKSVFYVYVKIQSKDLKSWLLDPGYNLLKYKELQNKLKELIDNGNEIGLHGSFNSATDKLLLEKEKLALERVINRDVKKVRQHWLRYRELITPYLHEQLFKFDSSLGWNDIIGFRSGIVSKYRPYDHINNKAFNHYEIPQIIMDSSIFDYSGKNIEKTITQCLKMINLLKTYKSVYVAISWHQRSCSNDYNWHKLYEKIIYEYL